MDLKLLQIDLNEEDIKKCFKNQLRKIVKNATKYAAFKYLEAKKTEKSNMQNIKYNELKMQNYKQRKLFCREQSGVLSSLRTRIFRGI